MHLPVILVKTLFEETDDEYVEPLHGLDFRKAILHSLSGKVAVMDSTTSICMMLKAP